MGEAVRVLVGLGVNCLGFEGWRLGILGKGLGRLGLFRIWAKGLVYLG